MLSRPARSEAANRPHRAAKVGHPLAGNLHMALSTWETPGAAQASRSASSFSAQERTLPRRVTLPPSTSTVMRPASPAVLRRNASLILALRSIRDTRGLTMIRLLTPFTPVREHARRRIDRDNLSA